ncbi:ABC transporter permease [Paenibacillus apiarius]|uniref:Transport permease protein n=1 Tax=Paenibacillus apiarius TaxID=46240 RepID=A0ABT4DPN0_9BACL|nr:ABC transporter permease [Paenibacillus apiarius]MCY9515658.1 ABC transporter permease [Paenibacillus apiarius]MCY9519269.1 ABC transporter permease [Paenibacillus apiarius]MCY9550905.1 ABC transporter permease [Paenibacillus apiarius]MCY9559003.1 ABC transporter permease [Paenibacillus apiarius]MCY9683520.1 ABC transporter permease [Paenibacillus apiarius]
MNPAVNPKQASSAAAISGPGRIWTELSILFRIQFAIVRDSWVWVVLMATMFPLTTTLFMSFFADNPSEEMMIRIIAGNLIFGVIVMGMNGMGQEISWQKHQGHFTYYASLPISKLNFVLANLLRGLMNTLPSFIILAMIGQWGYGIEFHYSWGLPVVVILSLASVVGIGVCIGFWSPNHQLTNMLVQALMMFVTFLSPVMIDIQQLPVPLQWLSYLFPTTYAADAMRNVLLAGWSTGVMLDCVVLLAYSAVTICVINNLVKWRIGE